MPGLMSWAEKAEEEPEGVCIRIPGGSLAALLWHSKLDPTPGLSGLLNKKSMTLEKTEN